MQNRWFFGMFALILAVGLTACETRNFKTPKATLESLYSAVLAEDFSTYAMALEGQAQAEHGTWHAMLEWKKELMKIQNAEIGAILLTTSKSQIAGGQKTENQFYETRILSQQDAQPIRPIAEVKLHCVNTYRRNVRPPRWIPTRQSCRVADLKRI